MTIYDIERCGKLMIKKIGKSIVVNLCYLFRNILRFNSFEVVNVDKTIDDILNSNKSLIRFGDGEIAIIRGFAIRFQEYSEELKNDLLKALYCNENDVMIAIPDVFSYKALNQYRRKDRKAWIEESFFSYSIYARNSQSKRYYTSLVSRLYLPFSCDYGITAERFNRLFSLWNNKNILIVEGKYSRLGCGNDMFQNAGSIWRILCPPRNAYRKVNLIEKTIIDSFSKYNVDMVLLALGPTSKVIVNDLHKYGRFIDIGHIDIEYEWFRKKTNEKIAIQGKYVNEVEGGDENLEIYDEQYQNEIIITLDDN